MYSNSIHRLIATLGWLFVSLSVASADGAITGPRHQANIGKIVFAKERLTRDNMETIPLSNRFSDVDAIYGRAYLGKAFGEHKNTHGQWKGRPATGYHFRLFIDGQLQRWLIENIGDAGPEMAASSTLQVFINPKKGDVDNGTTWKEIVEKLPPGSHQVRVELFFGTEWDEKTPMGKLNSPAVGEFTLVRSAGGVAVGEKFSEIKATQSQPDLEKSALATINTYASDQGWKEKFDKVKVVGNWEMVRHQVSGILLGRRIDVAAAAKWPDGKCTYQIFSVTQEHDGKTFMPQTAFGGVGKQTRIDCE